MAIKCLKCKYVMLGINSLHMVSKCSRCGNKDMDMFIRIDDEDIDPRKYKKDKEWLESHKAE